jgi:hypothetical protein
VKPSGSGQIQAKFTIMLRESNTYETKTDCNLSRHYIRPMFLYVFQGIEIEYHGCQDFLGAAMNIQLDSQSAIVNTSTPGVSQQPYLAWSASNLDPAVNHTLTVTFISSQNPSLLYFDYLFLTPSSTTYVFPFFMNVWWLLCVIRNGNTTTTQSPSPTPSGASNKTRLSNGVLAGVIVCVVIVVLCLVIVIHARWRKRAASVPLEHPANPIVAMAQPIQGEHHSPQITISVPLN